MDLWKLRFSMIGTLALILGMSTLFFTVILTLSGVNLFLLPFIVVVFNIIQWFIAPYLIDIMYRVKELKKEDDPELYGTVERLSRKSKINPAAKVSNTTGLEIWVLFILASWIGVVMGYPNRCNHFSRRPF